MSRQRLRHQRSTQNKKQILQSRQNKVRYSDKNRHVSRVPQRHLLRKDQPFLDFFSNPLGSFSNPADRGWYVGIVTITLAGAFFGFFYLPSDLFAIGGMRIGVVTFFSLGAVLKPLVKEVRTSSYSPRSLFWWSTAFLTVAIVGAILGSFFLPGKMLVASRILLGVCLGWIGLTVPIVLTRAFIADPIGLFRNLLTGTIDGFLRRLF